MTWILCFSLFIIAYSWINGQKLIVLEEYLQKKVYFVRQDRTPKIMTL